MHGLSELRAKFQALADPTEVDAAMDEGITDSLSNLVSQIQSQAWGWGRVKQRIQWGRIGPRSFWVGSEDPVAGYLEFGTKPHIILPVRKKYLRFQVAGGGFISRQATKAKKNVKAGDWYSSKSASVHDVFAKKVNHPGTQARPAIGPALADWAPGVPGVMASKLMALLEAA